MIWIVGRDGMLGADVRRVLTRRGLEWTSSGSEVDVRDPDALKRFVRGRPIQWIVNCSAYTAVDRAEDEPEQAFGVNAHGAGLVAALAHEIGARLVHISTDYVFDGTGARPRRENDPVRPLNVYGSSKWEGEKRVREFCPEHYILRTSWLYGAAGPNFVRTMLRLMAEKSSVGVVADHEGLPPGHGT